MYNASIVLCGLPQRLSSLQYKRCTRPRLNLWVGRMLWRRAWQPTPIFLPGEFHGQWSLAGYSPWGHKELDTAEWISLTLTQVSGEHDFKYLLYHYGGMWPRQACQTLLFFIFSLLKWEGGRCEDRALLNLSAWETYLKNHSLNSRCVQSL